VQRIKILITVKTYPIPSAKYDELVCTAGVREDGSFVRLYPVNFRDLPFSKQYRKYQWIEVAARRHAGRDARKESYRPDCDTIELIGQPLPATGNWRARAKYALAKRSVSMEELREQRRADGTSMGVFKPKEVLDLTWTREAQQDWKPAFKYALAQARLWENRRVTRVPPRKLPYKFQYSFNCDDGRCRGHRMMIADWELGALYWRAMDNGATPEEAANTVRQKFLGQMCAADRDTHFFVGTTLAHPNSWLVVGVFWPKLDQAELARGDEPLLFE
jgi:hypothetical protein